MLFCSCICHSACVLIPFSFLSLSLPVSVFLFSLSVSVSLCLSLSPPPPPPLSISFLVVFLCPSVTPYLQCPQSTVCIYVSLRCLVLISLCLFASLSLFQPLPWLQPLCLCLSVSLLVPSCSPVFLVHSCKVFRVLLNRPVVMNIVSH